MNNEEKMLTIEDAYDAVVDYLEKLYDKTKSEHVLSIVSGMPLFADGGSADPAMLEDWHKAVEKTLNHNLDIRQNFELSSKRLTIKQAYEVMINFLDTYPYFTEIIAMLGSMRLSNNGAPTNPESWTSWVESVNKILSQNPRNRPLFFGINSKTLTVDDAYDTMIDYLNGYYNRTKTASIESLLEKMKRLKNGEFTDLGIQDDWNKAVDMALKQNVHKNKDPQLPENGLSATEGYNTVINFLNTYNHKVNSSEIVTLLNGMKFLYKQESTDPEAWSSWLESVNKTLNKYRKF